MLPTVCNLNRYDHPIKLSKEALITLVWSFAISIGSCKLVFVLHEPAHQVSELISLLMIDRKYDIISLLMI